MIDKSNDKCFDLLLHSSSIAFKHHHSSSAAAETVYNVHSHDGLYSKTKMYIANPTSYRSRALNQRLANQIKMFQPDLNNYSYSM